jgi:hypothetical protein
MSDRSVYVEDELMEWWPYLPNPERVKIFDPPRESMNDFLRALDLNSPSPVLSWKASRSDMRPLTHSLNRNG